MQSLSGTIISRIYGHGRGWAFSRTDFTDLGKSGTIDVTLFRLREKGTIRRVLPGIYDYPRHSRTLNENTAPDVEQIARALARKHRWQIVPDGQTALHFLGLSEQVPAQYRFLSTGPNRTYTIMRTKLGFKHEKTQHTAIDDEKAALLVQGLGAIGEGRLTHEQKQGLSKLFSPGDYRRIVRETATATAWIADSVKEIAALCEGRQS